MSIRLTIELCGAAFCVRTSEWFGEFSQFQWTVLFEVILLVHRNTFQFDLKKTRPCSQFKVKLPFGNQHCVDSYLIGKMFRFFHFSIFHALIYSSAEVLVIGTTGFNLDGYEITTVSKKNIDGVPR